jgi:hypothetical protein
MPVTFLGKARDQAELDRIAAVEKDDGYRRGRGLGGDRRADAAGRKDHVHPPLHQIGRQ